MPIDRPMVTAVVCLLTAALTSASERSLYRLKIIFTREAKLSAGPSGPGGRAFLFDYSAVADVGTARAMGS